MTYALNKNNKSWKPLSKICYNSFSYNFEKLDFFKKVLYEYHYCQTYKER